MNAWFWRRLLNAALCSLVDQSTCFVKTRYLKLQDRAVVTSIRTLRWETSHIGFQGGINENYCLLRYHATSILNMEAEFPSEMLLTIYQTIQNHISDDNDFHSDRCENTKSRMEVPVPQT
jgi:hypothetical protein